VFTSCVLAFTKTLYPVYLYIKASCVWLYLY